MAGLAGARSFCGHGGELAKLPGMFQRCPKCGHHPLPADQALPAACPACGVILAKVAQARRAADGELDRPGGNPRRRAPVDRDGEPARVSRLLRVPERVDVTGWWLRVALLAGFLVWGVYLVTRDYRTGELGQSFIHGPLLVFHEAGHVLFMPLGEWMTVLGGTLGQLLMPALLAAALLLKNRDPFGAAIGLWLFGVSLLDVAPYMFDALHPQLMLLSGTTGEEGGHDWIHLFSSMGLLPRAQFIGALTHKLGALVVLLALVWGAWLLRLQWQRRAGDVLREE